MIKFIILLVIIGVITCCTAFFFNLLIPELIEFYINNDILENIWDFWLTQIVYHLGVLILEGFIIFESTYVFWNILY